MRSNQPNFEYLEQKSGECTEVMLLDLQERNSRLSLELEEANKRLAEYEERVRLQEDALGGLRQRLEWRVWAGELREEVSEPEINTNLTGAEDHGSDVLFDDRRDTLYASADPHFGAVAHLFHQEWVGVRAAAGTLPGRKVAFRLTPSSLTACQARILRRLDEWKVTKVVMHSYSSTASSIARCLRHNGISVYAVWHGNLAQLHYKAEAQAFVRLLADCEVGVITSLNVLRKNSVPFAKNQFMPMLLNHVPVTSAVRLIRAFDGDKNICIVPALNDHRKNVLGNVIGTTQSRAIRRVFHYAKLNKSLLDRSKCRHLKYPGINEHFDLLRVVDVCTNVTVIDCHPMVDLEAIACGVPSLTGPLFLDALEEHEYRKLTIVDNPLDAGAIAAAITGLSGVEPVELEGLIKDYRDKLNAVCIERYGLFLGL